MRTVSAKNEDFGPVEGNLSLRKRNATPDKRQGATTENKNPKQASITKFTAKRSGTGPPNQASLL